MISEPVQVVIAREIETNVGTIAKGTTMPAVPALDGGWQLELSLPRASVPSHPVTVSTLKVQGGRALLARLHAHHDYRFAREVLGYSNVRALDWIREGYEATERQLYRWGFTNPRSELAA